MQDSNTDFHEKNWSNLRKDLKKIVGETAYNNSKDYCMPQEFKKWAIIDGYTYYEVLEN